MLVQRKLEVLADSAKYDASCASGGTPKKNRAGFAGAEQWGICHSYTPDGRCVSLLKVLLTNHCIYDCAYCINRQSSDVPRATFEPRELAELTSELYRRNYIEGLFLSSGIVKSPDYTLERMIAVVKLLRNEYAFAGYVHLKAIPGAARELVDAAALLSDRVSCNVELASVSDLARFAPEKRRPEIEGVMKRLNKLRAEHDAEKKQRSPIPAGQTTQMIVGASDETDRQILGTAAELHSHYGLRRVYYSAYSPIPSSDGRLPFAAPPLMREHRLYQADWLFRSYGFTVDEILPPSAPNLNLSIDPKLAWALRHPEFFPIDINVAERTVLFRVPGIGKNTVSKIVNARRFKRLRFEHLRTLGVVLKRAVPFIVVDGMPSVRRATQRTLGEQLSLFDPPREGAD